MGTTPIYAIPYVESSDRLADFPASDKAQAQRVEQLMAASTVFSMYARTAADFTVAASTDVVVSYDTGIWSYSSLLPYVSGTWTFKVAGLYMINVSTFWALAASVQSAYTTVWKNGVTQAQACGIGSTLTYWTQNLVTMQRFAVNDTVQIKVRSTAVNATVKCNSQGYQTSCAITQVGI